MQSDRQLGFWMCTALVVGNTIGVGIFLLPASLAPYGLNALAGWAITTAGMTVVAASLALLARRFPDADGPHAYLEATSGRFPAFVATWCYWVQCWITNATIPVGVVGYLDAVFPSLAAVPAAAQSLTLLWGCVAINVLGVRAGGRVQVATAALKLVPLAAVIALGVVLLVTSPGAFREHVPTTPIAPGAFMAAGTIALFAMLGVESAAVPAGRVRDAGRTVPRATLAGTLVTALVYVAVSSVALFLIPQAKLAASAAPFADLLDERIGRGLGRGLAAFVVISGLGALNGWTLVTGDLTATMAGRGALPAGLARRNDRGAPVTALLVTAVLATATLLMNYSKSLVDGFTFLTEIVTAASLPLYVGCAYALVVLARRAGPGRDRTALAVGAVGLAYTAYAFVGLGREPFLWALALGAAGLPVWLLARRVPPAAVGES
jgi:APA family basic amino acid/polyamine antiporter